MWFGVGPGTPNTVTEEDGRDIRSSNYNAFKSRCNYSTTWDVQVVSRTPLSRSRTGYYKSEHKLSITRMYEHKNWEL